MFQFTFVIGIFLGIVMNVISMSPSDGKIWENGVIPIEIKGAFRPDELDNIEASIDFFNEKTCIKFVNRTNEEDFVTIQNTPTGCWTSVGRVGGEQFVNLESPKCTEDVALFHHKLMHVLGFDHVDCVDGDHFHQAKPLDEHDIKKISELYDCKIPSVNNL